MEEESFNDVMGHAPVYSSGLPGVSVTNPAEFKEWHGRVRRAHEREVAVGVAAMTTAQLAAHGLYRIGSAAMWDEVRDTKDRELSEEHGLVRLPVDAYGVPWTGEEQYATFDGSEYNVECLRKDCHGWKVQMIDLYGNRFRAPTELCRHVPDAPADPHAELADELDTFASMCVPDKDAVSMLEDYIDAEHERAMADAELAAAPTEAQLEEWGYVKLPVDAEGKTIHVGDVMEWCDSGETLTVEGIGRDVLFYIDGENAEWTAARNKRHRHAPTVEDGLREFAEKITDSQIPGVHPTYEEAIAECAAKLRLAGENA